MGFILIKVDEPSAGEQFPFDQLTVKVGRSEDCDLAVMDASVSRSHASLSRGKGGTYTVTDLGSGNGTFVNGKRLAGPRELQDGDELRFGSVRFQLALLEEPESAEAGDATLVTAPKPQDEATRLNAAPAPLPVRAPASSPVSTSLPRKRQVGSAEPETARAATRAMPSFQAPAPAPSKPAVPSPPGSPTRALLASLGLAQYTARFETAGVDPENFHELTDELLRSIGIVSPAHRKTLLEKAAELRPDDDFDGQAEDVPQAPAPSPGPSRAPVKPAPAKPAGTSPGVLGAIGKLFRYTLAAIGGLFLLMAVLGIVASATKGSSSSPSGSAASGSSLPARNAGEDLSDYCDRTYRPTFQLCCDKVGGSFGNSGCSYGSQQKEFFDCVTREQDAVGCKGHEPSRGGGGGSGVCGRCLSECEEVNPGGRYGSCRELCRSQGFCG